MTRIIAGSAGGRSVRTPPGTRTRPTSDRVREAIFSSLDARGAVVGAHVLDLYAGSGALGLEAASRGAARVLCVDSDRAAAQTITTNARSLELESQVEVVCGSVATLLGRRSLLGRDREVSGERAAYTLVFADPPYDLAGEKVIEDLLALVDGGWLSGEATVVLERGSRSGEPMWPAGIVRDRMKTYGDTTVWFATVTPDHHP